MSCAVAIGIAFLASSAGAPAGAAVNLTGAVLHWNFENPSPTGDSAPASLVAEGITVTPMTSALPNTTDGGNPLFVFDSQSPAGDSNPFDANVAGSPSGQDFRFAITVGPGFAFTLDRAFFHGRQMGTDLSPANQPETMLALVSEANAAEGGPYQSLGSVALSPLFSLAVAHQITLRTSGGTPPVLPAGTYIVRFRPTNAVGRSYAIDDLTLYGSVTSTPEPAALSLIVAGAAAFLTRRCPRASA